MSASAFQHDKTVGHDEWLTPPSLLERLGTFDLDPCAPIVRPWDTAKRHFTIKDNGLAQEWQGRVFLNPPYGRDTTKWMQRMANHTGGGIALIFARTDTTAWQEFVFPFANSILFLRRRLTFFTVDGKEGKTTAGAPSALIAYGNGDAAVLELPMVLELGSLVKLR